MAVIGKFRFTYRPTMKSTFIFTMGKDYFRPDITYLNPYEDKSVSGRIIKGNPGLENEKKYSSMLMYRYFINKKLSFHSLVSMNYSGNAVQKYSYMGSDGILTTTYGNISRSRGIFFAVGVDGHPSSWH